MAKDARYQIFGTDSGKCMSSAIKAPPWSVSLPATAQLLLPAARPLKIGYGSGDHDLGTTPNLLRMVLVDGFFHADPHPGNVILLPGGRLGMIDLGMVGRLTQARRFEFLRLLAAVVDRREDEVVDLLLGWSRGDGPDPDAP